MRGQVFLGNGWALLGVNYWSEVCAVFGGECEDGWGALDCARFFVSLL